MAGSRVVPHIHLLCMDERFSNAFETARLMRGLPPSVTIEIHNMALQFVPASTQFDLIVSPANSYGRLDGAFDDAISRAFSPKDDYFALTRVAQSRLYQEWRGFAPPGTCTLLKIPDEFKARSKNVWGTRYVALCPTMRTPKDVTWDREVIYECVWSLLCSIDKHNRSAQEYDKIQSILMTPLATGIGRVSAERWAHQLILALNHYVDAVANAAKWSALEHQDTDEYAEAMVDTWTM
ncbi:hypothetical protein HIM_06320 [Hirsutella minnesotensis 3608]|uniref:Macro-like domain-containing protein n=1 Tax=Hirsutella minnesotensis 3608 TaxID=1043627 RepID=A0A0F8A4X0_9HYPO|nr:hypothetical protein HIM_06320 [Hirsutella minnesotensis 3608]